MKKNLSFLFDIDLEAGKFFWKNPSKYHSEKIGSEAGGIVDSNGKKYWAIKIDGKKYKRGRLVFLFVHGRWPMPCVDHIDGDSLNDVPLNLRESTVMQNTWNHKSRAKKSSLPMGVRELKSGKFQARIACKKKTIYLGVYETPDIASSVYQTERKKLFKEFA